MLSRILIGSGGEMLATESPRRFELKVAIRRNMFRGLIASAAFHFLFIAAYYLPEWIGSQADDVATVRVRVMRYSELGPPPSIASAPPSIAVSGPTVKPSIGIPVPVPDAEISPEQTLATQEELAQMASPVTSEGLAGGELQVEQDIMIDEPGIDEFIPVEKLPIPIKQVKPDYPEVARRAGMEGTVWVKILIDKEGIPRKVVVVKSDAEVFNAAATQAAMEWRFTPAIMNKGPVAVWVAVPFKFKLQGQPS